MRYFKDKEFNCHVLQLSSWKFTAHLRHMATFPRTVLSSSICLPFACGKYITTRFAFKVSRPTFRPTRFNCKDMVVVYSLVAFWANSYKVFKAMVGWVNCIYSPVFSVFMMNMKPLCRTTIYALATVSHYHFIPYIIRQTTCEIANRFTQKTTFSKPESGWVSFFSIRHFFSCFFTKCFHMRLLYVVYNSTMAQVV